ncbi:hypothetical protein G7Z17_g6004 [Cylindrodendrum hubeiense]|uniref:Uncharacterized protein n=1 Tax=Cylindrodendrum hubeiense TaxID=595255 RepID=A0A9P5L8L7_9HYPO|nr:hypothetical protein G7Z17_g6004 [Cylindrodendrum hubeiense]
MIRILADENIQLHPAKMQISKIPAAAIFILAQLSTRVQANYESQKATQLNFYKDDICTHYAGEMAFWHWNDQSKSPVTGYNT